MGRKNPPAEQILEQIRKSLKELHLKAMLEGLEENIAAGPEEDDTRYHLLWRLVERESRQRRERAVQRRIKEARFPAYKTLDDFDFKFQTGLKQERVLEFATLDFVRRGRNLLIAGMSGTGKSHIAISLGYLACAAQHRVLYTTSAAMLSALYATLASHELPRALRPYIACDLLIIDEVGLDRVERVHVQDAQLFYKVISPRYETSKSTIITSNIPWESWGKHFGDDIATVPILDRLVHHGLTLTIDGPSYRAAEHQRLNTTKPVGH